MEYNVKIIATITEKHVAVLANRHFLQQKIRKAGKVQYTGTLATKFQTGYSVNILKNKLTIRCSLEKFYAKKTYGRIGNVPPITIAEIKTALECLLFENDLEDKKINITYYSVVNPTVF